MAVATTRPRMALFLIVASTVLGLMGTDLVLPAVPFLPAALGGDAGQAQLVLAAYVAGTCLGLLLFGTLGDRFPTRRLIIASLLATAVTSMACAVSEALWQLVVLRLLQGAAAAGPAVFAPGIVRALFDERRAVGAIGLLGSIESMAPAFAPILGAWLLTQGGWDLSFEVIAVVAVALALANIALPLAPQISRRSAGRYVALIGDPVFLRYALSQAFVLGGLLVFVFGAPAVFVLAMGGALSDFIVMQIVSVAVFVVGANATGALGARFGAERMIGVGTGMATLGAGALLAYVLAGGAWPLMITGFFAVVGLGLGLRGPHGFYHAVLASHGDDARGSALVILAIMGTTAIGTAVVAPFIRQGPVPLALAFFVIELAAAACLVLLPRLRTGSAASPTAQPPPGLSGPTS